MSIRGLTGSIDTDRLSGAYDLLEIGKPQKLPCNCLAIQCNYVFANCLMTKRLSGANPHRTCCNYVNVNINVE